MNTKVNEGKLISGDEAKKAWANGETVEFHYADTIWSELPSFAKLSIFDDEEIKFRVKPKTILINGIEVPAPFLHRPEVGQIILYLDDSEPQGFTGEKFVGLHDADFNYGWWDSVEKIKVVVAALRQVFGGNHE